MHKNRAIPFFNYRVFYDQYNDLITKTISDVLKRGAFILQEDLLQFEQAIANYLGVKYAIGVANCTDGLFLALQAAGIKPKDEVILPSHTFIATASAIHDLGATPTPVECNHDHMLDPSAFEKAITSKTTAVIAVQLNGRTCDMDPILTIAKKHNLLLFEDAAQALGSKYKNQFAGTFGSAAAFSFYPAKILGCLGDGGMVVTNDEKIACKIYQLRDHGRNQQGEVTCWGYNSRLDNLHAAILNAVLKNYPSIITRRREIAALYTTHLENLTELKLPPPPSTDKNHFDVYQNYEIEAEKRDALQDYLKTKGIGTIKQWDGTLVHQFSALGFKGYSLPFTENMMEKELLLPMNMSITDDDIKYICSNIHLFYKN